MKWLFADGDLWLLAMMIAAGIMPAIADFLHRRAASGEATLGLLVAVISAVALFRRLAVHLRASAVRRRLL